MDKTLIITLSLTSAAIGALVSNLIGLFGQWRERKARRQELLLDKAIVFANWRWEIVKHNATVEKRYVEVSDLVVATEKYYQLLNELMKTGKLPDDYKNS